MKERREKEEENNNRYMVYAKELPVQHTVKSHAIVEVMACLHQMVNLIPNRRVQLVDLIEGCSLAF